MPPTTPEPYAVVSCHVERPLDDRVWSRFARLQERRPGGFRVAALMRPPDPAAGEHDVERWLARAREAAGRGPLGHHTHFTSPTHARPTGSETGARVLREAAWLREHGVEPTLFCGGGWYTDRTVALACAELGYADCTPRATRPGYLPEAAAWAQLAEPAVLELSPPGSGQQHAGRRVTLLPTTHGVGDLVRSLLRPALPGHVHAYFHDTDLLDVRRRATIALALRLLRLRRAPTDLDALAEAVSGRAPRLSWESVARGEAAEPSA